MTRIKIYLVLVVTFFCIPVLYAQTIPMTDTAFGNFLCANHARPMNETCDSMVVVEASRTANGTMDFSDLEISAIDELVYFLRTDIVLGANNNITRLPSLPASVDSLDLSHNRISEFSEPFINGRSNLDPLVTDNRADLSNLNLSYNLLIDLPRLDTIKWLLKKMYVQENNLRRVFDLTGYVALSELNVSNNRLTFEDLIPIVNLETYDSNSFVLIPQKQQSHKVTEIQVVEGSDAVYSLSIDSGIEGSTYEWMKNGEFFKVTSDNFLEFSNIQFSDSGSYTVKITNSHPAFDGFEITFSNTIDVKVIPSMEDVITKDIQTFCKAYKVNLDGLDLFSHDVEYFLIDSAQNVIIELNENNFTVVNSGDFDLVQTKSDILLQYLDDFVSFSELPSCHDIISPNDDGVDDNLYFNQTGIIRVLGKSGNEIRELNGPIVWDVKDKYGNLLEPGLYMILFPNGSNKTISVLY